jgi:hypothetical protein
MVANRKRPVAMNMLGMAARDLDADEKDILEAAARISTGLLPPGFWDRRPVYTAVTPGRQIIHAMMMATTTATIRKAVTRIALGFMD